jgi:23S rRNA pseudouridine2605 synthase
MGDKTPAQAEIVRLKTRGAGVVVEVRIREGRKHEVKRLLKWAGAPVLNLSRVSFAGITVGNLPPGEHRLLASPEIAALRRTVGLDRPGDGV